MFSSVSRMLDLARLTRRVKSMKQYPDVRNPTWMRNVRAYICRRRRGLVDRPRRRAFGYASWSFQWCKCYPRVRVMLVYINECDRTCLSSSFHPPTQRHARFYSRDEIFWPKSPALIAFHVRTQRWSWIGGSIQSSWSLWEFGNYRRTRLHSGEVNSQLAIEYIDRCSGMRASIKSEKLSRLSTQWIFICIGESRLFLFFVFFSRRSRIPFRLW